MGKNIKWKTPGISIAISLGIGLLATFFVSGMGGSYRMLPKVPLAPPAWLFPVVWTILYTLMGVAAYLVWVAPCSEERNSALLYYAAQLLVNFFWPLIFFRWKAYVTAFFWLVLLWYLVFVTYQKFSKLNRAAGGLLIPYLVWLTFAAYLNLYIAIVTL